MKKLIILALVFLCMCGEKTYYGKVRCYNLPFYTQEDRIKQAEFIENVVKNTNNNLTTSDYEHPEEVIQEAAKKAKDLFYHNKRHCIKYECNDNFLGTNCEQINSFDEVLE
jgi:hypothetical protein